MRKIFAIIEIDDDRAIAEDKGTGEYLEQEFGWLEQSGITLNHWLVSDYDDVERWARYIDYLIEWAFDHSSEDYDGMSPACYDEWCDMKETEENEVRYTGDKEKPIRPKIDDDDWIDRKSVV